MKYRYIIKVTAAGRESWYISKFVSISDPERAKKMSAWTARRVVRKLLKDGRFQDVEVFPYGL